MAKKYEILDEAQQMVSESVVAYRTTTTPHVMIDSSEPCSFTDEEFKEELLLSESSGFVGNEDFKKHCFEKWDVVL